MDVFSLEEEDYSNLFITQEIKSDNNSNSVEGGSESLLGMQDMEVSGEGKVSVKESYEAVFSDILDEDFEPVGMVLERAKR